MDTGMNSEKIIQRLIGWLRMKSAVRAAILSSSRTIERAPVDQLSDYDVILVVSDMAHFLESNSWLSEFGEVLVRFNDESEEFGIKRFARLVIYRDGTKIDFSLWPLEMLERVVLEPQLPDYLDAGYQVLFDRTGLAAYLKPPTHRAFILHKPTEAEFHNLVNEFWWETTYVAKYLWREDLFAARYSFDSVIRLQLLVKMLQWYVEIGYGWTLPLGPHGRHLKKYLPSDIWFGVETTFAGPRIEENWDALFSTTELFRRVALDVADNLEYRYLHDLDEDVTDYLAKIRSMTEE